MDMILSNVTKGAYRMIVSAYGEGISVQESKFNTEALTIRSYQSILDFQDTHVYSVKTKLNDTKDFIKFLKFVNMDIDLQLRVKNTSEYMRIACLLEHMVNVRQGLETGVTKQHKTEMNSKRMPTKLIDVEQVITVAKEEFDKTMQRIGSMKEDAVKILTKTMVAFINRYITAYLCLGQGHRVGEPENLKYREYLLALEGERTCNVSGVPHLVINVADQKTAATHDCRIALNSYWINMMIYITGTCAPASSV
ncbi:hypothetical protein DPMN_052579 [Dreissena polymorpha]|uniref:Uncharacterized protein n=1 Tax=Dreissena polymorpha TaxID=45954 RepID=A0A9D4CM07_DREPO|nr:hypothetical protein DPMN_052579 [Dreissena polymorpha]